MKLFLGETNILTLDNSVCRQERVGHFEKSTRNKNERHLRELFCQPFCPRIDFKDVLDQERPPVPLLLQLDHPPVCVPDFRENVPETDTVAGTCDGGDLGPCGRKRLWAGHAREERFGVRTQVKV